MYPTVQHALWASSQRVFWCKRATAVKSGALSHDVLTLGQVIYSDQFSARVKGRGLLFHSGVGQKEVHSRGTVFYDVASKFLCVELQVRYTATKMV